MHRANSHPTPASGLGWTSMPAPFEDPNVFFSIGRLQTDRSAQCFDIRSKRYRS